MMNNIYKLSKNSDLLLKYNKMIELNRSNILFKQKIILPHDKRLLLAINLVRNFKEIIDKAIFNDFIDNPINNINELFDFEIINCNIINKATNFNVSKIIVELKTLLPNISKIGSDKIILDTSIRWILGEMIIKILSSTNNIYLKPTQDLKIYGPFGKHLNIHISELNRTIYCKKMISELFKNIYLSEKYINSLLIFKLLFERSNKLTISELFARLLINI